MMAATYRHPVKKKLRRCWWIYFNCYEIAQILQQAQRQNIA
jgi:hypothetical protein